jgi:urea transport system ATP-binding protein
VADRFVVMEKGRSVASGSMDELTDGIIQQYLTV